MDWLAYIWVALVGINLPVWFIYHQLVSMERQQSRTADALGEIASSLRAMDERAMRDQRERSSAIR